MTIRLAKGLLSELRNPESNSESLHRDHLVSISKALHPL